MFSKWEMLFRGFPSLLSKDSLDFIARLIQQVPTGERHPVVGRPGQSGCHSKALKVLTSSSYRCLVYTHFKSVYCDWPHPICWCCKALMVPNKGGRHTVPEMGKKWGSEGDQEGERQMMSLTIKYHNGKAPSATSNSRALGPSVQIITCQSWKARAERSHLPDSRRN